MPAEPADRKRLHRKHSEEEARRWESALREGDPILKIAAREGVDPATVSGWLHRLGVGISQGRHRVAQPPLACSPGFVELLGKGREHVMRLLAASVWGFQATEGGSEQLAKFCRFVGLHHEGKGVAEVAEALGVHRSTVAAWRRGSDQPYLVRLAAFATGSPPRPGFRLLPLHLASGAAEQSGWVQVPESLSKYDDLLAVLRQLQPLHGTPEAAAALGIDRTSFEAMRPELFAYLLAMMAGDSSKSGGSQERFASMSLDLQLTMKHADNERLGTFVCMCANSLGIKMGRIADKAPSGATRRGRSPSAAYRWTSERSPLLAWMFSTCLGLRWWERTSYDQLRMEWILHAPREFRLRFAQGIADSDGSVKHHQVIITSVPNTEFLARVLRSVGVASAHAVEEGGRSLRVYVQSREAARLPLFNEIVAGYRFQKLAGQRRVSTDSPREQRARSAD